MVPTRARATRRALADHYAFLDDQINESLGVSCGFESLVKPEPWVLEAQEWKEAAARYERCREFLETTLSLFQASLAGDFDPEVADLLINEAPPRLGPSYYHGLAPAQVKPPVYFRTDEVVPGKACEIQCPGSLWGVHEQLHGLHTSHHHALTGASSPAREPMSAHFARSLRGYMRAEPVIHHYIDGSTNPAGTRFFIQRTRAAGLRYRGYDRGIGPRDCNFVRHHIFQSHECDKFQPERRLRCEAGELWYDLPPLAIFSEKIPQILPFWEKTRSLYSDRVRDLFPYTALVTPAGVRMEDGTTVGVDEFCRMPAAKRTFFLKYASSDLTLCSRGKGVFYAKTWSRGKLRAFFDEILAGWDKGKYWILQTAHLPHARATYLTRHGELAEAKVHSKISTFYGPDGLMGILLMQRPFYKVHGTLETITTIAV